METGGMKGKTQRNDPRRTAWNVMWRFWVSMIHSEYGMTELLSQAYSLGKRRVWMPSWIQVLIRDTENALSYIPQENRRMNVI
jgi:hypothetical protein